MVSDESQKYKKFVQENCVRDSKHMKSCLLVDFHNEIISLASKLSNLKRLLLTDGKYTDFNDELFEKLTNLLKLETENSLLLSDVGRSYLSDFGPIFVKQITFCSYCLRLGIEINEKNIDQNTAELLYAIILNYYLAGKNIDIHKVEQLKLKLNEKELLRNTNLQDEFTLTEFPEISEDNIPILKTIKEYLNDVQVKEVINKAKKDTTIEQDKIKQFIEEYSSCVKCRNANGYLNCFEQRKRALEIIEKDEIKDNWHNSQIKYCIAKILQNK